MKKIFFCMLAVGGILTGCSNDEMIQNAPDAPKAAIGFNTTINKNSRSVEDIVGVGTSTGQLSAFKVWGYESQSNDADNVVTRFNGVDVTYNGTAWTYTPEQYWTANNWYWFAGYHASLPNVAKFVSGGTSVWPKTQTLAANPVFGGTMYFNNGLDNWKYDGTNTIQGANGGADLVYAWWKTTSAVDKGHEPVVDFTFKHLLSKVAFKFVNNLPYSTLKITSLVVNGVPFQGTLNMNAATPTWNATGTGFDMDYTTEDINNLASIAPGANATSDFNIFIPAAFDGYNIQFVVEVYQGPSTDPVKIATYTHNVNTSGVTLEMGHAYVLTATLDKTNIDPAGALKPISFNPSVEDWTPADGTVVIPTTPNP